jgi:hypothetical protein
MGATTMMVTVIRIEVVVCFVARLAIAVEPAFCKFTMVDSELA